MSQIQNRSAVSLLGAPFRRAIIGFMFASELVGIETIISTQGVFVDLNLDASAEEGSNINLWSVTNTTTGELTYNGLAPFDGSIIATIASISAGGVNEFHFRTVKNGSPLIDNILAGREIGNVSASITLLAPICVDPNDTIRIQVSNEDGTSNISIHQIAAQIA